MPSFESLLVKGILVGISGAIITVILFYRWTPHGAMTLNLIKRYAFNFLGGIGLGYVIILVVVVGVLYGHLIIYGTHVDVAKP